VEKALHGGSIALLHPPACRGSFRRGPPWSPPAKG